MILAGMEAHPRARRRERIAFPVQPERLSVAFFTDQRHETGNIHARGAGALARRAHERRANAGRATPVPDVRNVFVAK